MNPKHMQNYQLGVRWQLRLALSMISHHSYTHNSIIHTVQGTGRVMSNVFVSRTHAIYKETNRALLGV